jgi:hypothetical protein
MFSYRVAAAVVVTVTVKMAAVAPIFSASSLPS